MHTPQTKKSLGQHWLRDEDSLEAMCEAAAVQANDTILEIGPGLGTLTELLVEKAEQVVAVEFDEVLFSQLPTRVPAANLQVVQSDILSFDLTALPSGYKVVANIPYYLTSNLIRVISESANPPQVAVLLVQKEVAERVAAAPGAMSLLSVTAQYYWDVSLAELVPAALFTPPPKVDSQILVLHRRDVMPDSEPKQLFKVVKAGFSQRRKTLLNSLSGGLQLEKTVVRERCEAAGIAPSRRAQTLSLEEWAALAQAFNT